MLIAGSGNAESGNEIEEDIASNFINITSNAPVAAHISQPIGFDMKPMSADDWEVVPLADACDRYIAEMVVPYPPGIPLLYPGEQITDEVLHILKQLADQGAKCQGVQDAKLQTLRVLLKSMK
jgi:arginine/lysine/ornithine decarboxylase